MDPRSEQKLLKRLLHEIFTGLFGLEWIYLGLNGDQFFSFKETPSILDSQFNY
jgi:hypothetical protein